jgi:hypothetical protein
MSNDDIGSNRLRMTKVLYGIYGEAGKTLLFAVEASDSAEATRRIGLVAPALGIDDLSRGSIEELEDREVNIPVFYDAYFCEMELAVAGPGGDFAVH